MKAENLHTVEMTTIQMKDVMVVVLAELLDARYLLWLWPRNAITEGLILN